MAVNTIANQPAKPNQNLYEKIYQAPQIDVVELLLEDAILQNSGDKELVGDIIPGLSLGDDSEFGF